MSSPSLKAKTLSGMIWVGIQRFGNVVISFASNIVLARMLSPDDYGCIGMLMIFIALSNTFIDGGFGSALIQKTRPTQDDYSTVFYWNIGLSIVLYSILFLCAPLVARFYQMPLLCPVLRVQGLVLIINAFTVVQMNQLRKKMMFKKIAIVNVVAATISVSAAIIYAYNGGGVWALVLQQLVLSSSVALLLWIICRWVPRPVFSVSSFKELFGFGSFILLSNLINTFSNNLNGLVVGKFFSAGTLGYLTQARKIEDIASTSISSTVEQVTYPLLVEVKDDFRRMAQILRQFNTALLSIVAPAMLMIVILAEPIIVFLFSDKWLPSVPILRILCFQGIFICLQGASYNVVAAIGKSASLFRWTIIKRVSGIIVWIIAMIAFGFEGLLCGMVLTSMIIWLCNAWLVRKFIGYKLHRQILDLVPVTALAAIPFALVAAAQHCELFGPYDMVYGVIYISIYLVVFLLMPHRSIRELKSNLLSLIKRK